MIDLADDLTVAGLTASPCRKPYPRRYAIRMGEKPIRPRARCRCGECAACLDDAKWERIFREKFADPEYYNRRPLRSGSSLLW
jgi:hypothetical protein